MRTFQNILIFLLALFLLAGCQNTGSGTKATTQKYTPDWQSLRRIQTPEWLQKGKFGIYTHWGPYAVHAYGSNTTWYSFALYLEEDGEARQHFEEKFGKLTPEFGYKDLIPLFTAEKFDADEWADLFQKAGARYAGPVAEHHDGFSMWESEVTPWNAMDEGPMRDITGELKKAFEDKGLKLITTFHHARHLQQHLFHSKEQSPKSANHLYTFHRYAPEHLCFRVYIC